MVALLEMSPVFARPHVPSLSTLYPADIIVPAATAQLLPVLPAIIVFLNVMSAPAKLTNKAPLPEVLPAIVEFVIDSDVSGK